MSAAAVIDLDSLPGPSLRIGGDPVVGRGDPVDVSDPATGRPLAEVHGASVADGLDAVAAAHGAQPGWAAAPPVRRSEVLRRTFELMQERSAWLARLIVAENGKALSDATAEIAYAAEFFRWFAGEAVRIEGRMSRAPAGDKHILVTEQPVGVALLVTPWNFPAAMITRKVAPALAAGCSVVVKPAPETPLTALAIADLMAEAGAPPGVVNVVPTTDAAAVVAAALADSRVRKLSFTGSTEVGRRLLALAADRVVGCSMELGGNAPFLVLDDADLDEAVAGAVVAKIRNGGAACTAANRFYVADPLLPSFTDRLTTALAALRVGPGLDEGTEVGPLVSAAQRDRVATLVDAATSDGAQVRTGGAAPDRPGFYYPPTVLAGVDPGATLLEHEIFGPVAPIIGVTDEDEAIDRANDTAAGLIAYVYTGDLARGLRVAERLEAGMVGLNRGLVSDPAAPFGGWKHSGLGREGSHEGLHEFLELKYVAADWSMRGTHS